MTVHLPVFFLTFLPALQSVKYRYGKSYSFVFLYVVYNKIHLYYSILDLVKFLIDPRDLHEKIVSHECYNGPRLLVLQC